MAGLTVKCPSCGSNLEFNPAQQKFVCPNCGSAFTEAELGQAPEAAQGGYKEYHCQNCGAEVVTTDTTAASRCYYCHSPVVMEDRLSGDFRPDGVIPFKQGRDEAMASFKQYIGRKKFVDRRFFNQAQMENFSGVYEPGWYGEIEGNAAFSGTGNTSSSVTMGDYIVTTVRTYQLERKGTARFRNVFRKGLRECDRQLLDGVQPFDLKQAKDYHPGYLSGFLAEMRDIEAKDVEPDIAQETRGYASSMIQENSGLQGLSGTTAWQVTSSKLRYVLLPVWILTYRRNDRTYYYMMNGQTGKVCGKLPIAWQRLTLVSGIVGGAVFGLLCLGGAFLW